ncbi:hypothetical protein GQX74_002248 [Glossina fuscipes]|nr:hypothetical protein GQX74_002248 [Glossina fuscipes]
MQRSIYTISKSNWNEFGHVSNDVALKSIASTKSAHALQNENHSNRSFVEIHAQQPTRRRVKKKRVNVQRDPDKKQYFIPNISAVTITKSTTQYRGKKAKSKDFIKENIANVAKNSNQIRHISKISIFSIDQCKSRNFVKENIVNVAKQSSKIKDKSRISKCCSANRVPKKEAAFRKREKGEQNRKKLRLESPSCSSTELHFASGSKSQNILASCPSSPSCFVFGNPKALHQYYKNECNCCRENLPEQSNSQKFPPSTCINENIETWIGTQNTKRRCHNASKCRRRTVRRQALRDLDTSTGVNSRPCSPVYLRKWQSSNRLGDDLQQRQKRLSYDSSRCSSSRLNVRNQCQNALAPRSKSITRVRKLANADPVSLYEYYRNEWNYFRQQIPGEARRMQWHTNLLNQ